MALADMVTSLRQGAMSANPVMDTANAPVLSNLPEIASALDRKYSDPTIGTLSPEVQRTLAEIDLRRARRNQLPTTVEQTANIVRAVQSGQLQTKPPDRKVSNVLGNFLRDLRNIVTAVPRLPIALAKEANDLSKIPAHLANPDDNRNIVAKLASAPGIRMVPGSYVVENLAEGDFKELATHPLMTALDVLPVVNKAAAGTKVGKVAVREAELSNKMARPIKAVLTRTLDDAGDLIPNKLGRGIQRTMSTKPGQLLSETFGAEAREMAYLYNSGKLDLMEAMNQNFTQDIATIADKARVDTMRDITRLNNDFRDYTPDDMARVTRSAQLGDYANLSTRDMELVTRARDLTDKVATWGTQDGWLAAVDGELYPAKQAAKIMRARANEAKVTAFGEARDAAAGTLTLSVDDIATRVRTWAEHPLNVRGLTEQARLNLTDRYRIVNGYLHALDAQGFDVRGLQQTWRESQRSTSKVSTRDFLDELDRFVANPSVAPVLDPAAIMPELKRVGRTDPLVRVLVDHLDAGRMTEAAAMAKRIAARSKFRIPALDDYIDSLARQARRDRYVASIDTTYNPSATARSRATKLRDAVEARYAPARFQPLINEQVGREIADLTEAAKAEGITGPLSKADIDMIRQKEASGVVYSKPTPENARTIIDAVIENRYADYVDFGSLRDLQDSATATWQKMKDAGLDPLFVHRISPEQARNVAFPSPTEVAKVPSVVKERTVDFTPGFQDLTVALTHQAQEFLGREISEALAETIHARFGVSRDELVRRYLPEAQRKAATDPRTGVGQRLEELIKRDYQAFDPRAFGMNWPSEKLDLMAREQVFIPRTMSNVLQRFHQPSQFRLQGVLDPVTGLFRNALLPFSPRWHVNNILGNTIMMLARTDPRVFLHLREALEWTKNPELAPVELRRTFGGEVGMLREFDYDSATKASNFLAGKTLGRLFSEAGTGRVAKAFGKAREASYDANQFVDNMSRAMTYLYATKTKGRSANFGLELARHTFQQWAEMTPIERQVIRYVFPFYGFTQHILRYVTKYPLDHPVRASILSSITRAELQDMKDGLPERFLGMFFFGDGSVPGSKRAINLSSFNPFGDVANLMTFTGFLAGVNPVLGTAMEQMGFVDGNMELYPTLRYDPETGRLVASAPNPIMGLISNTIPQTNLITSLLGMNAEFNQRLTSDPASAMRYLYSSGGLPIIYRQVDTSAEIARNELAAADAQQKALNDALKSGNYDGAQRWPGLRDKLAQIQQLRDAGQLEPYNPSTLPNTAALTSGI